MSRAENISALVCLDLDGTLLNRAGQVSERNRAALISCLDKGAAVCFVTGRPYCFAKSLAVSIDPRIGVVAGAGACYEWEGELIEHPLPEDARRKFVDCLARSSAHAFFKGRRLFYTHDVYDRRFLYDWMNDRFPEEYRVQSLTELTFEELKERTEKIHKILVYEEDSRRLVGAQMASTEDISMGIHVFSLAIEEGVTIDKLKLLDIFFLPHFNQPYNYITMAALKAE